MSTDGGTDKQEILDTHNGTLCSLKKEGNPGTHYDTEEA